MAFLLLNTHLLYSMICSLSASVRRKGVGVAMDNFIVNKIVTSKKCSCYKKLYNKRNAIRCNTKSIES